MIERREYALGTFHTVEYPWGLYRTPGRALCEDGKVRALKRIAETADTFFSVPASVTANGLTVSGYVTVSTVKGYGTATPDDPAVLQFRAYKYGKNHDAIGGTS